MKKVLSRTALLAASLVLFAGCLVLPDRASTTPSAGFRPQAQVREQAVTFRNRTGYDIWYLYVSERSNDRWGPDVLGDDILYDGRSFTMYLLPGEYDVQAKDEDDDTYTVWIEVDNDGGTFTINLDHLD